jgi:pyrroloquinoline-quinone synthase
MTSFFARVDEIRSRLDVLRHPFYERWSRGELELSQLAFYAGQYRHAVVALAEAAGQLGEDDHADEERSHVALWDGFVRFVGGDVGAMPTPQTAACAAAWADEHRDRAATLAALYAIEAAQPAISETKRAGLLEHYGSTPGGEGIRYFDVHAELDHVHAAHDRQQLLTIMQPTDEERLLVEIERVLLANWRLLDGVMQRHATAAS